MSLKYALKYAGVIAWVAVWSACKPGVPESELVAKVNAEGITKKDFDEAVDRNLARYKAQDQEVPAGVEARIRDGVLRRMIDDKVIEQKAKALGMTVSADELEAKFKEHKDRFRNEDGFNDYLKRSGNTVESMRDDLRRNLLRDRVVEQLSGSIDVTPEEVEKFYQDNQPRFVDKEQIKVSRILVRVPPNATDAEKKAAHKEAKELHAKAIKTGADFAEIAKNYAKTPESARGGDLGTLTRGRMSEEFDQVAFKLEPGKISDVVETKQGYEIIKVFEKRPETQKTLDEVKDSIQNQLLARKRNEKRRDVVRELKSDAKVEQFVTFDTSAQMGPRGSGADRPLPPGVRPPRGPLPDKDGLQKLPSASPPVESPEH